MNYAKVLAGLCAIGISFFIFLLALMRMFPLYLAAPLLYISIVYTLSSFTSRKHFKGFRQ